jgi:hypothetical protein
VEDLDLALVQNAALSLTMLHQANCLAKALVFLAAEREKREPILEDYLA